jgi:hypothetical protein
MVAERKRRGKTTPLVGIAERLAMHAHPLVLANLPD